MNAYTRDTIFALSSGSLPAAIGVVRVSGPRASDTLTSLAGRVPSPRQAQLSVLRVPGDGQVIDKALVLFFPGPRSDTGEDVAEFHIHGGRAVASALSAALVELGVRPAEPGEFTRRAFENGRLDLTEVEGRADLIMAETEAQRRAAVALAGGALRRQIEAWQRRLLVLSAELEATLDFSDEGEVGDAVSTRWTFDLTALGDELSILLSRPPAERLREGVRVVIAGPVNAGKSTLLNWLAGRDAAITSAIPGTTRDLVEAPTALGGTPFLLIDTAGLRESRDEIEAIGVARAQESMSGADILLWLGDPADCPDRARAIMVQSKADLLRNAERHTDLGFLISPRSGEGMQALVDHLIARAREALPREGEMALNARQRGLVTECHGHLVEAASGSDLLISAEALRSARTALHRVTGAAGVEDMLDALFGSFCIGK